MRAFRERQVEEERQAAADVSRRRGPKRAGTLATGLGDSKESSVRPKAQPTLPLRNQQFTAAPDDSNAEERDAVIDLKLKHLNTSPSTHGKTIRSNNMTKASGTLHHMND